MRSNSLCRVIFPVLLTTAACGTLDSLESPTARLTVIPQEGIVGTEFTLDASSSTSRGEERAGLEVMWDWEGDGRDDLDCYCECESGPGITAITGGSCEPLGEWDTDWSTSKVVQHTYTMPGFYHPSVLVRDSDRDLGGAYRNIAVLDAAGADVLWWKAISTSWTNMAILANGRVVAAADDGNVFLFDNFGNEVWKRRGTRPVSGENGTIYVMLEEGYPQKYLVALEPDGSEMWRIETGWDSGGIAVGSDDTIYLGSALKRALCAFDSDGGWEWGYEVEEDVFEPPSIGPDGTVYFPANTNDLSSTCLYALNPDGTLKWVFRTTQPVGSVSVAGDGTAYVPIMDVLAAVGYDGILRWNYEIGSYIKTTIIGADGTIYVTSSAGGLTALTSGGQIDWQDHRGGAGLIIGSDGAFYRHNNVEYALYARDAGGTLIWRLFIRDSPFLLMDTHGRLFVAGKRHLCVIQTESPGLIESAWPCPRGDARNTGRSR